MNASPKPAGLTLIELMITLSVMALVVSLSTPSFRQVIQENRMATQINEFVADFNLARSESVRRGTRVTLCKRNEAGNACSTTADWTGGWIVFVDPDDDGLIDNGEAIIRLHGPLVGLTALHLPGDRMTFDAMGLVTENTVDTVDYPATISFCDSRGLSKAKGLVLWRTGRLRVSADGDTLSCS